MEVYIVLDNGKEDYDASDVFVGVYSTEEKAQEYINRFDKMDRLKFAIVKHVIDIEYIP